MAISSLIASITAGATSPGSERNVPYAMIGMACPELSVYTGIDDAGADDRSKLGVGFV